MQHSRRQTAVLCIIVALCAIAAACSMNRVGQRAPVPAASPAPQAVAPTPPAESNVYGAAMTDQIAPRLAGITPRVYVPNAGSGTVDVIDPTTYQIIDHFKVGQIPHHITPSWDMTHLYVNNTESNTLTEIDPRSGKPTRTIPVVEDPYNLYYTADGSKAMVMAERFLRLDFRDPRTWELIRTVPIPWPGVDHLDFSADGRFLVASTEYSGYVARVDVVEMELTGQTKVGGLPIDVRLSPDGSVFYVANQGRGVSVLDATTLRETDFLRTGKGAHGFHISRDTKSMYVSNRLEGTISVIDTATRSVRTTWRIGGSPDMMQVSPDGRQLWVSNRFHSSVTVVDTSTGDLVKRIKVGNNPHGLTYFPQPGRFSLGHNGVYR